jgi:short-subunit dehydrogenase
MSLNNESVAVITGAASGIGRALAVRLAGENIAGIAISDVNSAGLDETVQMVEAAGARVSSHIVNVASRAEMESFVRAVVEQHGRATHVVNNAGVSLFGDVEEVSFEDIEWLMSINFWGVVHGTKMFLPVLRKQKSAHIINVSSVFGFIAPPGNAAYSASKFAVRGFTEALRHELANSSVTVSLVHPGGIRTNIANNGKLGASASEGVRRATVNMFNEHLTPTLPETAADVIVSGIKRREPRILIGADAKQISFFSRVFPRKYLKVMDFLTGGKLLKMREENKKAI